MKKYLYVCLFISTGVFAQQIDKIEKQKTKESVYEQDIDYAFIQEITKNAKLEAVKILKKRLAEK